MRFLAPFAYHASLRVVGEDDVAPSRLKYRGLIEALRDDRIDLDRAAAAENLMHELDTCIGVKETA